MSDLFFAHSSTRGSTFSIFFLTSRAAVQTKTNTHIDDRVMQYAGVDLKASTLVLIRTFDVFWHFFFVLRWLRVAIESPAAHSSAFMTGCIFTEGNPLPSKGLTVIRAFAEGGGARFPKWLVEVWQAPAADSLHDSWIYQISSRLIAQSLKKKTHVASSNVSFWLTWQNPNVWLPVFWHI